MEIIKQGNPDKIKQNVKFKCDQCDCEFIAEKGEWKYAPIIAQQRGEGTYICICPCCGHTVWKYEYEEWDT